jgi:hypothetical protein
LLQALANPVMGIFDGGHGAVAGLDIVTTNWSIAIWDVSQLVRLHWGDHHATFGLSDRGDQIPKRVLEILGFPAASSGGVALAEGGGLSNALPISSLEHPKPAGPPVTGTFG